MMSNPSYTNQPGQPPMLPGQTPVVRNEQPGSHPVASGHNTNSTEVEERRQKFMSKGEVLFYIPPENREDVWWLINFFSERRIIDEARPGVLARKVFFQWVNTVKAAMEADIKAGGGQFTSQQQQVGISDHKRSPLGNVGGTGGMGGY